MPPVKIIVGRMKYYKWCGGQERDIFVIIQGKCASVFCLFCGGNIDEYPWGLFSNKKCSGE